MRLNWFYLFIAIMFTGMMTTSILYFRGTGHSLVGVTSAKEYKINAGKSAQISKINVVSGQQVKEGDLLVELVSADLEMDIDKLSTRISTLQNERLERTKLVNSEIAYIRAAEGVEMEEINSEIVTSESELQLNQNLTKEFAGPQKSTTVDNPLKGKVELLKQQLVKREEAMAIKVKNVIQHNETTQNLLNNQVRLLQRELELLQQEKSDLKKYATTPGVVENIYVKQGEHADAYTSLLSINPTHPTTVVGYLLGKREELPVGAQVSVKSFEYQNKSVAGRVIGYGSVVPLPDILQKSTAVKAFGREVFIEIAPQNGFATGEKVLIR